MKGLLTKKSNDMKLRLIFLFFISALLYSACLIKSYNPFYLPENVIMDARINGSWLDQDSLLWTFEEKQPENSLFNTGPNHPFYKLTYRENDIKNSLFVVVLFELNGKKYLDFLPDMETITDHELFSMHLLPVHTLAQVNFGKNGEVEIKWFNEDWLNELIKAGKTQIDHHRIMYGDDEGGTIVLSASTAQLQQFILEFGDDPDAFDCDDQYGDSYCRVLTKN